MGRGRSSLRASRCPSQLGSHVAVIGRRIACHAFASPQPRPRMGHRKIIFGNFRAEPPKTGCPEQPARNGPRAQSLRPVAARLTPSLIITSPPVPPISASRRRDATNHCRAVPAAAAHALSRTSAMAGTARRG